MTDKTTNNGLGGGLLEGDSHQASSGGIQAVVTDDNNRPVLLEGKEVIINKASVESHKEHTFDGKKMTNKEVLNEINTQDGNGVPIYNAGGEIAGRCPVGTKVQTLILSKDKFDKGQATVWAENHGYYHDVDENKNSYRFRQIEPDNIEKDSFRTISFTDGIQAVIGCPVNKKSGGSIDASLKEGIRVEKEHVDLYNELDRRLKLKGVKMPMSKTDFYTSIAKTHIKEGANYYDLLKVMEKDLVQMANGGTLKTKNDMKNAFIGDAYFEANPQNILGTQSTRKGQFGNEVIFVTGGETDVEEISVPVIERVRKIYKDFPVVKETIENIITDVFDREAEKSIDREVGEWSGKHVGEEKQYKNVISLRESIEIYNKGISREEIEAYLFTNPDLNWKKWIDKFTLSKADMITKGLIFYHKGEYIYRYLYLSGNINNKISQLSKKDREGVLIAGSDGEYVFSKLGEDYYNEVLELLEKNKPVQKLIGEEEKDDSAIVILPHADLTKIFAVTQTANLKYDVYVPIFEIFQQYLREVLRNSDFQEANREEIIKYYLQNKNYVTGSQKYKSKEEIAKDKRNEISMKQRTKREGDRLFRKFLVEELLFNDRQRLEIIWNERYNGIRQIEVEKIPVAFTFNKHFKGGVPLKLEDTQRNGVAYHTANGSSIIAYDVGVGKTLTCIATISSLIDNNVCKFPLIVVPNSVYDKWSGDLQGYTDKEKGKINGALEHLPKLRHLYNMNNDIAYNLKTYTEQEERILDEKSMELQHVRELLADWISNEGYDLPKKINPEGQSEKDLDKIKHGISVYSNSYHELYSVLKSKLHDLTVDENMRTDSYNEGNMNRKTLDQYIQTIANDKKTIILKFKKKVRETCVRFINASYTFDIFNLGTLKEIEEGTISLITYEGLNKIGVADNSDIVNHLYEIISQGDKFEDPKEAGKLYARLENRVSSIEGNPKLYMEDLGLDFIAIDEGHAYKKIFTSCKGNVKTDAEWDSEKGVYTGGETKTRTISGKKYADRENSRYDLSAGTESTRALTGYILSTYVQWKNKRGNIMLLTATPFENNPLEIYSMLSLVAHQRLVENNFGKMKEFFDTFMRIEWDVKLTPSNQVVKDVVLNGFNNLQQMRSLIRSVIDHKTGEQADVSRPDKYVIPNYEEKVMCSFEMTELQKELMDGIESYIMGETEINDVCSYSIETAKMELSSNEDSTEQDLVDQEILDGIGDPELKAEMKEKQRLEKERQQEFTYDELTESEQEGVRIMQGLSFMRSIAWSPYYFKCFRQSNIKLTAKDLINTSPKLKYTMECIRTVKKWHEKNGTISSGQVIYSDGGVEYFEYLRQYLIEEVGYKESEVAIVRGGIAKNTKSNIMKRFLSGKILVLIGSRSIQVGVDLQDNASVMYNLYFYFNPTAEKQAEGRVWRQGNRFGSIRIVYPMCENSADPIMFQYLGEKTLRLKEIWDMDGVKSQLDLTEFDPSKMKNDLITDPRKKAKIELILKQDKLEADAVYWENQVEDISRVQPAIDGFKEIYPITKQLIIDFNKSLQSKNKRVIIEANQKKISAYEQMLSRAKDKEEKDKIEGNMEKANNDTKTKLDKFEAKATEFIDKLEKTDISTLEDKEKWEFLGMVMSRRATAMKSWLNDPNDWTNPEMEDWYSLRSSKLEIIGQYLSVYANYRKYVKQTIEPLGISEDDVEQAHQKINDRIKDIESQLVNLMENFEDRVLELEREQMLKLEQFKSPEARAGEFAKLNTRFLSDTDTTLPDLSKKEKEGIVAVIEKETDTDAKLELELITIKLKMELELEKLKISN